MKKKIKIVDYTWHVMHQMDMINALKDDCEFYYVLNSWRSWNDERFKNARPVPKEINFIPYYEEGEYDIAILHIDQQAVDPKINKARIFQEFNNSFTNIPKVVINHGCPVYPEFYDKQGITSNEEAEKMCRKDMRDLIGDLPMVVNSHTAASPREWGWGTPIVHGMDPKIWFNLEKEPRVFSALSPAGMESYYNRECMRNVIGLFNDWYGHRLFWAKVTYKPRDFDDYREFLGRSLIYFDPSIRTPMNRARTEAMLSGCCVVQVEGAHDLDRWAKHNENIILVPNNAEQIAKILNDLIENEYDRCVEIGRKGREMAIKEFAPARYRKDWLSLINKVTEKHV